MEGKSKKNQTKIESKEIHKQVKRASRVVFETNEEGKKNSWRTGMLLV
jgi:hypothetical protein